MAGGGARSYLTTNDLPNATPRSIQLAVVNDGQTWRSPLGGRQDVTPVNDNPVNRPRHGGRTVGGSLTFNSGRQIQISDPDAGPERCKSRTVRQPGHVDLVRHERPQFQLQSRRQRLRRATASMTQP